jgi:hypothetical protein
MSDKPIWERLAEMGAAADDPIDRNRRARVEAARIDVELALRQIHMGSDYGVEHNVRTATLAIEQLIRVITETK